MPTGSFRGGRQVAQTLWGAWTNSVYSVDSDGILTQFSTLAGSDRIHIGVNNASSTPNIAVVTDVGASIINTTAGAVQAYPDGDVGSPSCVCDHENYLMFGYGNGNIQASDLNSMNLNTLNLARTETNPDGVVEMISFQGNLYVFGNKTIEIWGDPVNATGFPLTRVGYNITPGIRAAHCIAGWEPEFGNSPIYIGHDNTVRQLVGFQSVKISPPDLDRLIADVLAVDEDQLEVICYVTGGHAFAQVNGPTFSWVFNLNNQKWHERRTHLSTRSQFTRSVPAFDKWLVGSTDSSDLLHVRFDVASEAAEPLVAQIESLPVEDFPNRQAVHRADFDVTMGVGIASGDDPIETDPTILVEWSDDGGQSWRGPWWRKLGRQDITDNRVTVFNTGLTGPQGRRWRLTVSDPVHFGVTGGDMDGKLRRK